MGLLVGRGNVRVADTARRWAIAAAMLMTSVVVASAVTPSTPATADTAGARAGAERRLAAAFDLGNNHACAIVDDADLICWGLDADGQVGNGDASAGDVPLASPLRYRFRGVQHQ
ncbi:MAG: RCC1 domain-containing protein [Actinomycetota bacterium]